MLFLLCGVPAAPVTQGRPPEGRGQEGMAKATATAAELGGEQRREACVLEPLSPPGAPAGTTASECSPSLPCPFREERLSVARRDTPLKHVVLACEMIVADVGGSPTPKVPFILEEKVH